MPHPTCLLLGCSTSCQNQASYTDLLSVPHPSLCTLFLLVARPSYNTQFWLCGFPLEGDTEGMSGSAFSHVQYRAAAEGSSTLWSLSCQLCISPLSSSGLQLRGSHSSSMDSLHGFPLASLHGTGVAETLELQQDRTSVLGTPLGRGSRAGGVPASPDILCGWIIWPMAGNWCPVPSFSCAGVRLPLP